MLLAVLHANFKILHINEKYEKITNADSTDKA